MGQYYCVALKDSKGNLVVNRRKYKGSGYVMAKLLEHGYLKNHFCQSVANVLAQGKTKLAWVGDYAEDEELSKITGGDVSYDMVWGENSDSKHEFGKHTFNYRGKYLVNHTKGAYISFDMWQKHYGKDGWVLCPFAILTAIGNGRGGGDYFGSYMELVGSWAWDEISIEKKAPEGMELLDFSFQEER